MSPCFPQTVLKTDMRTAEGRADTRESTCKSLAHVGFLNLKEAPTQITYAQVVEPKDGLPGYCNVSGYVWPQVGFELRLPLENWNGKFIEIGCGGYCGGVWWTIWCPLKKGYACIASNMGHAGGNEAIWAYQNLQAQIDFGYRGAHVTAVAGKAITERFYGSPAKHSFFHGCSSGGQQALSEAQRFPWDFDGIIAGAPSPTFSGPMMSYLWSARVLLAGRVSRSDLKLVHDRAVAKCDMDDGIRDGIIGDPFHCKFDPSELLCKPDKMADCLTADKVAAVKKVYSGPMTSQGGKIYTGGPLPGSELNWMGSSDGDAYISGNEPTPWAAEYFRYVGFMPAPGPGWNPSDFDFDRDYKRLRTSESMFGAADNPDLRKFKGAGGKLILYQGALDQSDIPADAVDYYETVERTMGGRATTQEFFRLFVVPGMNHCTGGAGAFAIDYLTYLEAWVEQGQAPDRMIGAHVDDSYWKEHGEGAFEPFLLRFPLDAQIPVAFTRPIFPYPWRAEYKGSGNPTRAENFKAIQP